MPAPRAEVGRDDELALAADFANTMMGLSGGLLLLDRALAAMPLDVPRVRAQLHTTRAVADLATRLARRIIHGPRSTDVSLGAVGLVEVLETALSVVRPELENVAEVVRAYENAPIVKGRDDDLVRVFVSLLLQVMRGFDPARRPARIRLGVDSDCGKATVRISGFAGDSINEIPCWARDRRWMDLMHDLESSLCARLIADQKGTLAIYADPRGELVVTVGLIAASKERP